MKTLDEVIKALEVCTSNHGGCEGCPYDPDCTPDCKWDDALQYLKEYKQTRQDLLDGMKRLEGKELMYIHMLANLEDNPPLTMKEFSRLIDTEPIWCQELQEWYLFLAYDDGDNCIQLMTDKGDIETFDEDDLEKYPLYRRK